MAQSLARPSLSSKCEPYHPRHRLKMDTQLFSTQEAGGEDGTGVLSGDVKCQRRSNDSLIKVGGCWLSDHGLDYIWMRQTWGRGCSFR